MAHFLVLVLVPVGVDDVLGHLDAALAPYDAAREVTPYRRYFDAKTVKGWARHLGFGDDVQALLADPRGRDMFDGADERGPFQRTTDNPSGEWDYWLIGGLYDGLLRGVAGQVKHASDSAGPSGRRVDTDEYDPEVWLARNHRPVRELAPVAEWAPELVPYAVVSADGRWHDLDDAGLARADAAWRAYVQTQLDRHPDALAVALDCHS